MLKADSLIRTKLHQPFTQPGLVPRARLQEQITRGLQGPFTLRTAPTLTYTAQANYIGDDSFSYNVTDRGDPDGCSAASCSPALTSEVVTVTIHVVKTGVAGRVFDDKDADGALDSNETGLANGPKHCKGWRIEMRHPLRLFQALCGFAYPHPHKGATSFCPDAKPPAMRTR